MGYVNLSGLYPDLIDGNLTIAPVSGAKRTLVLGTATDGRTEALFQVRKPNEAVQEFGRSGNLIRGMYEASAQDAPAVYLMRIGGTRAVLSGIGNSAGGGGYVVTPNRKDDDAGATFSVYYDDSSDIIMVYNEDDEEYVYSNDVSAPIDFATVSVTGSRSSGGGADIGTASAPVALEDVTATGTSFTAGTDGSTPSAMESFEALYNAYELLDFEQFDVVVPMDVFWDDVSVADLTSSQITARGLAGVSAYPTVNSQQDVLGKVFTQTYQGTNYFWWDVDADGVAEIYPSVGSATATTDINGDTINSFQEVNFGYQLATFCFNATENYQACVGVIGFNKPNSFGLADVATWVGELPEYSTSIVDGSSIITSASKNGTGLLGSKWFAGKSSFRGGVKYGGIIATDTGYVDGTEQTDINGAVVDIGKYLATVPAWVIHTNSFDTSGRGYIGSFAAGYAGLIARLPSNSAATNKTVSRVRLPYRIKASVLDDAAGVRMCMLVQKPKGVVVTDAPSSALPSSDYNRQTTMFIVAEAIQRLRNASDPFLGEPISVTQQAALNTAIDQVLVNMKQEGKLQDARFELSINPQQAVLGQATLDIILVPAFELRRILASIALAAEIA